METANIPYMKNGKILLNDSSITSLPRLPNTLKALQINNTHIKTISADDLPEGLEVLECSYNSQLTSIKSLPNSLRELVIHHNSLLQEIPSALPSTLKVFLINNTELTSLPEFPDTIESLNIISNKCLTKLPDRLPDRLSWFTIKECPIDELPSFPSSLHKLHIFVGLLSLPDEIPQTLLYVNFGDKAPQQVYIQNGYRETTPQYYQRIKNWLLVMREIPEMVWIAESRKRTIGRCKAIKEELMAYTWHTDRVLDWCDPNAFSWED